MPIRAHLPDSASSPPAAFGSRMSFRDERTHLALELRKHTEVAYPPCS